MISSIPSNNVGSRYLTSGAKIKTTLGWKIVNELQPNDVIIDPTGNISGVVEVYSKGLCEVLRIHFQDGRFTDSWVGSTWTVDELGNRVFTKNYTTTIEDLLTHFYEYRYSVPLLNGVDNKPRSLNGYIEGIADNLLLNQLALNDTVFELCFLDRFDIVKSMVIKSGYQIVDDRLAFINPSNSVINNLQALVWSLGGIAIKTNGYGPGNRLIIKHELMEDLVPSAKGTLTFERYKDLKLKIMGIEKIKPAEVFLINTESNSGIITDNYIIN